jgi:hypothetical protein
MKQQQQQLLPALSAALDVHAMSLLRGGCECNVHNSAECRRRKREKGEV